MQEDIIDRRTLLTTLGVGGTLALAGCIGQEGDDGGTDGGDGGTDSGTTDGGSDDTTTEGGSDGSDSDGDSDDDTSEPVELDSLNVIAPDNQTGPYNYLFVSSNKMTQIALDEIAEAGGPLGAEMSFNFRDTAVKPAKWNDVVTKGVFSDESAFVFGSATNEIAAHQDWIKENQVPVITGWPGGTFLRTRGGDNGTPDDTSDDDWVWRTIVGDSLTQLGAAKFAFEEKGWTKYGVFHGGSSDQAETAQAFIDTVESQDGEVLQKIQFQEGKTSYTAELDRMPWDDIDAVWIMTTVDTGIGFMRQWGNSEYGDKPALLQEWARPQKFVDETKNVLAGKEIYTMAGTPLTDNERYKTAKSKFDERYPDTDWFPQFTVPAYDAANVGCLAIHRAGTLGDLSADPAIEEIRVAIQKNIGKVARPPGTEVTTFAEGKTALDAGEEINYQGAYSSADFTKFGNVLVNVNMLRYPTEDESGYQKVTTVPAEELKSLTEGNY